MIPHESHRKRSASRSGPDFSSGLNLLRHCRDAGSSSSASECFICRPDCGFFLIPGCWASRSLFYLIEFFRGQDSRTSTQSGMRSTLSFVRPPAALLAFLPPLEEPPPEWRWGAAAARRRRSLSLRTGPKASAAAPGRKCQRPEPLRQLGIKFWRRRSRRLADLDGHGSSPCRGPSSLPLLVSRFFRVFLLYHPLSAFARPRSFSACSLLNLCIGVPTGSERPFWQG